MPEMAQKDLFRAVDSLVKSWPTGDYVHHVRLQQDKGPYDGCVFQVMFSIPVPTQPVPEHCAVATFTAKPPNPDDEDDTEVKISYTMDTQQQKLPGHLPIRKQWLDAAIRRKQHIAAATQMFNTTSKLPAPQPFVPGMYKAAQAVVDTAFDGLEENEERVMDAMAALGEAQDLAARNDEENVYELEQLLVGIFQDADKDGNGWLDPGEFNALLETAELDLDPMEKRQLLMLADANGDGRIEYSEFAPLGADVIQTMRMRKLQAQENELKEGMAEMQARQMLHGLGEEAVTQTLTEAFRSFDKDGSGRLERAEIVSCLQSLTLGATQLTPNEIRMIMAYIDEDCSGTVEYNEFAPLMFNWMVEALKLGFLQAQMSELEMYVLSHLSQYDQGHSGVLPFETLKQGLFEMDLVQLTPIQVHTLLADASFNDDGHVEIEPFVRKGAPLVQKMCDPTLEHKRMTVSKMATITPLQALTADEKHRLAQMAAAVFQQYDEDKSGKLDRLEFHKCLTESKLGFSERQIAYMMAGADVSEDGQIDYGEFASLFENCILELARVDAVEKMLRNQEAAEIEHRVQYDMALMLDELLIPLHLAFDIAGGDEESGCEAAVLCEIMRTKGGEWGLAGVSIEAMCERIDMFTALTWRQVVEIIEQLATGVDPNAPFDAPPPEAAPAA